MAIADEDFHRCECGNTRFTREEIWTVQKKRKALDEWEGQELKKIEFSCTNCGKVLTNP